MPTATTHKVCWVLVHRMSCLQVSSVTLAMSGLQVSSATSAPQTQPLQQQPDTYSASAPYPPYLANGQPGNGYPPESQPGNGYPPQSQPAAGPYPPSGPGNAPYPDPGGAAPASGSVPYPADPRGVAAPGKGGSYPPQQQSWDTAAAAAAAAGGAAAAAYPQAGHPLQVGRKAA